MTLILPPCKPPSRYREQAVAAAAAAEGSGKKEKKKRKKLQNQRDKLQPPTNAWTRVKAGQPGNFRIISTAVTTAASRPVKGDMPLGPAH